MECALIRLQDVEWLNFKFSCSSPSSLSLFPLSSLSLPLLSISHPLQSHVDSLILKNNSRFHVDDLDEDIFEDLVIETTEEGKYCLTGQVSVLIVLF